MTAPRVTGVLVDIPVVDNQFVEEGHQRIADELVDRALLVLHQTGDQCEMPVEEGRDLGGFHIFRHGRKPGDVGEHDGDVARVRDGFADIALPDQPFDDLARHVKLEPAYRAQHGIEGVRLLVAEERLHQQRHRARARADRALPRAQQKVLASWIGECMEMS